jgi:uncharacterized membrane protein
MTGGGTAAQEKITVQAASISAAGNTVVYLQQTGGPVASINSIIFKSSAGSTLGVVSVVFANISPAPAAGTPSTALTSGTLYTITVATPSATNIASGTSYTLVVTTSAGGSFISQSTIAKA